jgi:integrase
VVEDWRQARMQGVAAEQAFLDKWQDLVRGYTTYLKSRYSVRTRSKLAPLTQKLFLTVVKSFFHFYKIPVDVDLPRRACTIYHNQDLSKEQLRLILSKATQRDRAIFFVLAESGLRANSVVSLRYWQISEDFEAGKVPMRILTPASTVKDHVGDRWSFCGEDGAKALREYLKPRLPLKAQDYVFASEKPGLMKGEQFTEASISTKFRRITEHLKMERGSPFGKPGHYRLHGLRKYFFNNLPSPKEFRDFWMGHAISGSDEFYITRDPEKHRKVYAEGYEHLRILEAAQPVGFNEELKKRDQELQELREEIKQVRGYTEFLEKVIEAGNPTQEQKKMILERVFRLLSEKPGKLKKALESSEPKEE